MTYKKLRIKIIYKALHQREIINELLVSWESSCGVMTKVLDFSQEVSEFELQSRYYINYRNNTTGKII